MSTKTKENVEELARRAAARKVEPEPSENPTELPFTFTVPELRLGQPAMQPEAPGIPPLKSQERLNVESELHGMDHPPVVPRGKMDILNGLLRGASYGAMDPAKVMSLQQNQQQLDQQAQQEKRRQLVEQLQQMRAGEQQNTQNALLKSQNERANAAEQRSVAQFDENMKQERLTTAGMEQKANQPQFHPIPAGAKGMLIHPDGKVEYVDNPKEAPPQIPGRDIPYPPDVEAQRKRLQPQGAGINTGKGYADLDSTDKARVDAVRDKVASGEYTISQGLSALGGVRGNLGGALTESLESTRVLPTQVRTANSDIERARNLLVPVRRLVDEINKTADLEQKAKKSVQLEQYVQAIGTQFARARGERGVVTDQDVNRVLGLIPGWKSANFAPGYAEENLKLVEEAFNRDQQTLLGKYFSTFEKGGGSPTSLDDALDKEFGPPPGRKKP